MLALRGLTFCPIRMHATKAFLSCFSPLLSYPGCPSRTVTPAMPFWKVHPVRLIRPSRGPPLSPSRFSLIALLHFRTHRRSPFEKQISTVASQAISSSSHIPSQGCPSNCTVCVVLGITLHRYAGFWRPPTSPLFPLPCIPCPLCMFILRSVSSDMLSCFGIEPVVWTTPTCL